MEALKNCDHRVVGTKQVLRGLKSESLARVYVANDADTFLYQRIVRAAESCAGAGGAGSYDEGAGRSVRGGGCIRCRRHCQVTAIYYCL